MRKVHAGIASLLLAAVSHAAMGQVAISIQMNKPQDPVIGLPFSADQSVRTVQHLADGSPLSSEVRGHVYRSTAGIERYDGASVSSDASAAGATTMIYILDRAKHTAVFLNTKLKTARIEHLPPAATVSIRFLPLPQTQIQGGVTKPADLTTTNLGERTQGTMILVGKRVTRSIAAGKIGNEQPLNATTDDWVYTPLELLVNEVEHDPLSGERTFELTNIRREDSDPELFEIPPDYTIKEMPPMPGKLPDTSPPVAPKAPMTQEIQDALNSSDSGDRSGVAHRAAEESLERQQVVVDEQCRVLDPDMSEFQSNPDICHFDGRAPIRSSHAAAKEIDGVVQHSKVDVTEQTYMLQNIHSEPVIFAVVEKVPDGWHIDSDPQPIAMEGEVAVFHVNAQPGQIVRLHIGMVHETPSDDQQ